MLDEHGREMHGSWGNMIDAEDAFARMGADVMRWQYCAQPPDRNLLFGFGPAHEIKRKLLTFWNSVTFLVHYGEHRGLRADARPTSRRPRRSERPLDRWLVARTHELVREAEAAYEATLTVNVIRAFEAFVDDLSNWYIRRSRRRFYGDDAAAFRTLWYALVQSLRVIAPVMPFLADHLWRNLVPGREAVGAPRRLARGRRARPRAARRDRRGAARSSSSAARRARRSGLKLRQPLRRLVVAGAPLAAAHADEIADELRVKEVEFGEVEASELRVKPNLPVLGPKLGTALREVRARSPRAGSRSSRAAASRSTATSSSPRRCSSSGSAARAGSVASDGVVTVALDTTLDDELRLEARVNDLIRAVQMLRKEAGPRDHRPDPPLDPGRGSARVRRPDRRGDARRLGRARPELRLEKA